MGRCCCGFELRRLMEFGRLLECRYNLRSPLHIYAQMLRLISLGAAIECRDDETLPDYRPLSDRCDFVLIAPVLISCG